MKLKDLKIDDRPRERLIKNGPKYLTDVELLAIILGSGTKNEDVFTLSNNILKKYNFNELKDVSYEQLINIYGIKKAKACKLLACFEIAKRANQQLTLNEKCLDTSKKIYDYIKNDFYLITHEILFVIFLDVKLKVIKKISINNESADSINISIRKIVKEGINNKASCIVLIHNHPSNDISPSINDITTTNHIKEILESINIILVDHLIVGKDKYFSFNDNGLLNDEYE